MIGIECRGIRITAQCLPNRKRPSLCIEYEWENAVYPVASFSSKEDAVRFEEAIENMFGKKED